MKAINYAYMVGVLEAKLLNLPRTLNERGVIDFAASLALEAELKKSIKDAQTRAEEYAEGH